MSQMTVLYALGALVAGIPTAWAFGRYMQTSHQRDRNGAALWDMAIIFLSNVVTLTLWDHADNHPMVLVGWMLGNGIGTYMVNGR